VGSPINALSSPVITLLIKLNIGIAMVNRRVGAARMAR
jgi:hypothetical protein